MTETGAEALLCGVTKQAARLSVMRERRESVLWQLWDARDTLDASQLSVAQRLAQELGRQWTE